jgi:2-hydroxycyclohexanecarboxyl-CoA dehydrogenase
MAKKVALVTGAAAGIGRAIALRLARDGIAIGVLDLDKAACEKVAQEIKEAGGEALALAGDIAKRDTIQAAAAELRAAFGPINVLVNNAGITGFAPFLELTDAQWDRMLEVNLKGAFIVTQTILPDMIAQGWGRIVNISSSSAQSGAATMAHYSSAKGGIIALTKTLAQEFGPLGVTVNNIPPRFVMNTVMSEESFKHIGQEVRDNWTNSGPIRRQGEPEDIAGATAWLVSDEAGYVTGQTIGVNGGRYI